MFSLVKQIPFDFSKVVTPLVSSDEKFLKSVAVVIDQFDAQPFNLNESGWPRNDISQIARAQSKSEYDAIVSRLVVGSSKGSNFADGMTDEQIYDVCRSRYAQSPLELQQFIEFSNGSVSDYLEKQYKSHRSNTDDVKDVKVETESDPVSVAG